MEYKIIATLGGGNLQRLYELNFIANRGFYRVPTKEFVSYTKKLLEYGLIKRNYYSNFRLNSIDTTYGITEKGINALECYKRMRYTNTKKDYLLKEEPVNMTASLGNPHEGISWNEKEGRWRADLNKI
jgi:hypothetical protein